MSLSLAVVKSGTQNRGDLRRPEECFLPGRDIPSQRLRLPTEKKTDTAGNLRGTLN